MIQDFKETLEVTPLLPTDRVSLDMRTKKTHVPLCQNESFHTSHFTSPCPFFICMFVCFPQIIQGRICVCVRKRPLGKQGKTEVSSSIPLQVTSNVVKQRVTNWMICLSQRLTGRR